MRSTEKPYNSCLEQEGTEVTSEEGNKPKCPICGSKSLYTEESDGSKWGRATCGACGCSGPEVRTDYNFDYDAPWRNDAIRDFQQVIEDVKKALEAEK
jgi:ribosomal protein S27AE